ncbi:hypothetical protein D3P07_17885 [Paenibacillus sp. 1011MAR3C5]|uniref:hypothetical protein n=1 Tax=Paenibacillus sp. 1011MAR3C5 TaxID=1675787 RepID=UPI000E6BEFCA|nr:hypothetical protein [Paenibacillus sp. 1011MAR3C5]RJE87041.1 hypothetical protein D3P07_17885 [Paenibacillus sp. 1011MAR3C5]
MRYSRLLGIKLIVLGLIMALMSSCGSMDVVRHIEVFVHESMEVNEEGDYEVTGHIKANAITTSEESKNLLRTDVKMIEDYYDSDGNFIKSEVSHSRSHKSDISITDGGFSHKKELQEPSTIFIPEEGYEQFRMKDMSDEEKEIVKEHVLSYMKMLN